MNIPELPRAKEAVAKLKTGSVTCEDWQAIYQTLTKSRAAIRPWNQPLSRSEAIEFKAWREKNELLISNQNWNAISQIAANDLYAAIAKQRFHGNATPERWLSAHRDYEQEQRRIDLAIHKVAEVGDPVAIEHTKAAVAAAVPMLTAMVKSLTEATALGRGVIAKSEGHTDTVIAAVNVENGTIKLMKDGTIKVTTSITADGTTVAGEFKLTATAT